MPPRRGSRLPAAGDHRGASQAARSGRDRIGDGGGGAVDPNRTALWNSASDRASPNSTPPASSTPTTRSHSNSLAPLPPPPATPPRPRSSSSGRATCGQSSSARPTSPAPSSSWTASAEATELSPCGPAARVQVAPVRRLARLSLPESGVGHLPASCLVGPLLHPQRRPASPRTEHA